MAGSILNSERAVEISVYVCRAFIALRQVIARHKEKPLLQVRNLPIYLVTRVSKYGISPVV